MARATINRPDHPSSHVSYQRECQMALEPSITRLLEMAAESGWDARQATYAVMILAADHLRQYDAGASAEKAAGEPDDG